jgi:hypothetical protein
LITLEFSLWMEILALCPLWQFHVVDIQERTVTHQPPAPPTTTLIKSLQPDTPAGYKASFQNVQERRNACSFLVVIPVEVSLHWAAWNPGLKELLFKKYLRFLNSPWHVTSMFCRVKNSQATFPPSPHVSHTSGTGPAHHPPWPPT